MWIQSTSATKVCTRIKAILLRLRNFLELTKQSIVLNISKFQAHPPTKIQWIKCYHVLRVRIWLKGFQVLFMILKKASNCKYLIESLSNSIRLISLWINKNFTLQKIRCNSQSWAYFIDNSIKHVFKKPLKNNYLRIKSSFFIFEFYIRVLLFFFQKSKFCIRFNILFLKVSL